MTTLTPHRTTTALPVRYCDGEARPVSGTILETSTGSDAAWADRVVATLGPDERALCAIDFQPGAPGIAHRVLLDEQPRPLQHAAPVERTHVVVEQPAAAQYADNVRTALERITAGSVDKVVLGRTLHVTSNPPLDPHEVLHRLCSARPGRYVFSVPLAAPAAAGAATPPLLLGASPELLVRRRGSAVSSFPLAGSIPRVADPIEDERRARDLLSSSKDLREHRFVVDMILDVLAPFCTTITADEQPRLVSTDTLHHLGTRIDAILRSDVHAEASALRLAQLLQPTPAVGGTPRDAALALIDELEGTRGVLTGATGWCDARGDGEFAVTIRAGVLDGAELRLFAGAGIVAGSDPEAETRETGAKLGTMCTVVGL